MEGVPSDFRPWLKAGKEEAPDAPSGSSEPAEAAEISRALEARGLAALRKALAAPGRNRESAFHLLAADAYLTWAAEALVELPDPEPALRALLRRVATEGT